MQKKIQALDALPYHIHILIIILYLVIIFFPAFLNKGILLQTDQPLWAAVANLWNKEVFPSQHWFAGSFTDKAGAGMVMGEPYSVSLMLPWLFSKIFGVASSIKLAMLVSTLLFIVAFFFLACRYMPRSYALLSSFVLLTPMFDNIVSGMWYNYFSLGCGLIFWISCDSFFKNNNSKSVVSAILSLAIAVYAHPVGVMLCIAIWVAYALLTLISSNNDKKKKIAFLLLIPVASLLVAWPQIQAIVGSGEKVVPGNATSQTLGVTGLLETLRRLFFIRVWGGVEQTTMSNIFMGANIMAVQFLFALGLYSLWKKYHLDKSLPVFSLMLVTIILISRAYNLLGLNIGFLAGLSEYYDRFQLLSQIFLVLVAAVGIKFISDCIKESKWNNTIVKSVFILLMLCFVFVGVRTPKKVFIDNSEQLATLEKSTVYKDAINLWNWMNKNINKEATRVYVEDTYNTLHWNDSKNPESYKAHILALTNVYTEISQVNGWPIAATEFAKKHEYANGGYIFGKLPENITDDFIGSEMKILNCKYIVAHTEAVASRLNKVDFLNSVAKFGNFSVFENVEMKPAWAYQVDTGAKVDFHRKSLTDYELTTEGHKGSIIQISMAYHHNWQALYKNQNVPINSHDTLMQIQLPDEGKQTIRFDFVTKSRKTSIMIFAIGLILTIFLATWYEQR